MTLKEQLKKIKGNVKIGAKVGFFWCGVPDCDTDGEIENISDVFYRDYKKRLSGCKDYMSRFDKIWDNELRKRGENAMNGGICSMPEIRKIWEEEKKNKRIEVEGTIKLLEAYLKNWVSLLDREVKEHYPSIDGAEPEGTTIILIAGEERGQYWITKEFLNDKQRKTR